MNLYLNKIEIAEHVATLIMGRHLKKYKIKWQNTEQYLAKVQKKMAKTGLIEINFEQVNDCVRQDLEAYKNTVVLFYKKNFRNLCAWTVDQLDRFDSRTLEYICQISKRSSFVKSLGKHFLKSRIVVSDTDIDQTQPVLIRNIVNNESLLHDLINKQRDFWFIDSGYTNFLYEKRKPWHRLVFNGIHHSPSMDYFPADRLSNITAWPQPWRKKGNKILVVQSSDLYYRSQGINPVHWANNVENILRAHTDRPIEFRHKPMDRKTRSSVYDLLQQSKDYYCVVSDASAAAVEAIWCGVPVITLRPHITTPVARTQLEDINNLYRGPLGDWLCALTYSQFSYQELCNGTALKIIEKYHV